MSAATFSTPRKRDARRGQSIVESALTLLIALVLIIGIIEFSFVLFMYQSTSERARIGLRYGAMMEDPDETKIANVTVYGNAEGTGKPLLGLNPDWVSVNVDQVTPEYTVLNLSIERPSYTLITPGLGNSFTPKITMSRVCESYFSAFQ